MTEDGTPPKAIRLTVPSHTPSVGTITHHPEQKTGTAGWAVLYTGGCIFFYWMNLGPVQLSLPISMLAWCSIGAAVLYAVQLMLPDDLPSANPVNQWVPSRRKRLDESTLVILSIGVFIIAAYVGEDWSVLWLYGIETFFLGLILWALLVTMVEFVVGDRNAWPLVHVFIGYCGGVAVWFVFIILTFLFYW